MTNFYSCYIPLFSHFLVYLCVCACVYYRKFWINYCCYCQASTACMCVFNLSPVGRHCHCCALIDHMVWFCQTPVPTHSVLWERKTGRKRRRENLFSLAAFVILQMPSDPCRRHLLCKLLALLACMKICLMVQSPNENTKQGNSIITISDIERNSQKAKPKGALHKT